MKVTVAGGTGLIGRAITEKLAKHDHEIIVLSRGRKNNSSSLVQLVQWDGTSRGPWEESIDGADAVINLAGESVGSRWTDEKKRTILSSRVNAAAAIAGAIERSVSKPKVFINASAVGYYGHVEEGDVTESASPGNDFLAQTTVKWEAAALNAKDSGVRVVLMRTGFVIGREAEAFKRMQLPFKLFAGGSFGSGWQWFPWIHIDDVVAGCVFGIEKSGLAGPVNLSSPNPVRVKDLAQALGKAMRRPSFAPAPAFALKMILGEMSDLLLKGQKVIPRKLLEAGFTFRYLTLPEALRETVDGRT